MEKLTRHILNKRILVMVIFITLSIIFAICKPFIPVNYEMNDYLPEDSPSTIALNIMEEEFTGGVPNSRVIISDVSIAKALEYKEMIEGVEGVTSVMWLDDAINIFEPLEMQDSSIVESYYKDNAALFMVTIENDKRIDAVNDIRTMIGDDNAMSGSAVLTAAATQNTVSEIANVTVIAIVFVLFVLIITTTSWVEPLIILAGIGVSVLINMGSNIIFGEVSFVTNAAGNILQLAVSLDYSVFLLHRFAEYRKDNSDVKEAMVKAVTKSTMSISSSGLTTVIGFVALCLMRFKIGPDLGLALAKGIAISLITVFTFVPALILVVYKWIDKTEHRSFMPSFKGFGKVVFRIMTPLMCVAAIIVVPSYLASVNNEYYYGASHIFNEETQVGADAQKIESIFGESDTYVLMLPRGDFATETQLSDELKELSQITGIISYVDNAGAEIPVEYLDEETLAKLISDNYSRMVISARIGFEGEETFSLIEDIRSIADKYYPDSYYLAGEGVSTYDLMDTVTTDMTLVNLIAIGAVFLVLLVAMKSFSLPFILVLCIETAIWINMSIPYFESSYVFYIAYLIISSVQLGATVDYAILFTDRYKEFRQSMGKKQSIIETVSAVTVSIMTSGTALVVVGLLLGIFSTHGLLSQLGYFIGIGAVCSLVMVLFVLPAMLYYFDGLIQKTTKDCRFYKEELE